MKKVILSLVLVLSLGLASNLTVSKASATTYTLPIVIFIAFQVLVLDNMKFKINL